MCIDVNRGGFKLRSFHVNEKYICVENFIVKVRAYKTDNSCFFNDKFVIFCVNKRIRYFEDYKIQFLKLGVDEIVQK